MIGSDCHDILLFDLSDHTKSGFVIWCLINHYVSSHGDQIVEIGFGFVSLAYVVPDSLILEVI